MKKLFPAVLLLMALSPCFAQTGVLKSAYVGICVAPGIQTTSAALFAHNGDKPYPTFNAEAGMVYMRRLGGSRFYFETGAYLGLINIGFDFYHDGPLERVVSRHARLKIPAYLDYILPLGGDFLLAPSFGLGLTASYVSNISNGVVEDSDPGVGVVFPHLGLNMMKGHLMIGLSHDFFASVQSEIPVSGILQLNLAYLF